MVRRSARERGSAPVSEDEVVVSDAIKPVDDAEATSPVGSADGDDEISFTVVRGIIFVEAGSAVGIIPVTFRDDGDEIIFPVAREIIFVEAAIISASARRSVRGSASEREAKLRVFCEETEAISPVGSAVVIMPVVRVSGIGKSAESTTISEDEVREAAIVSDDEAATVRSVIISEDEVREAAVLGISDETISSATAGRISVSFSARVIN